MSQDEVKERNMVYTVEEITQRLNPVFEQNGVIKAILFGSYAKGTATENSDVDLVVRTEPHIKGYKFVALVNPIVNALGKDVDLVSWRTVRPDGPVGIEVSNTGKVIYERQ
jgi:predicted nucleotidyltransferase